MNLLSAGEAATALGISRATLYAWLADSRAGTFQIRQQPFTINYLQGGRRGQGRIQIAESEIRRLQEAMQVKRKLVRQRKAPQHKRHFPGITVALGLPPE